MFAKMKRVNFVGPWVALLVCGIATSTLLPGVVQAQPTENVKKAMAMLKAKAEKMGPATIKGEASVAGQSKWLGCAIFECAKCAAIVQYKR